MRGSIIHELPKYHRYLGGKAGTDIGYPWLTLGAIVALEQYIFKTDPVPKRVLEFGSGGSTIFFARRAEFVQSIETDRNWMPRTADAIRLHGLEDKVSLCLGTNPETEAFVGSLPDASFDLMLVDHAADETVVGRSARRSFSRKPLALLGLPKLQSNGWLVVDNYTLHGMQSFDYTGWDVWLFDDMRYSGRGTLIARRSKVHDALRPKA